MNADTLRALKCSIAHWSRLASGKRRRRESTGPSNCALCAMFIENACEGCPVMGKTGLTFCRGTPYADAELAASAYGFNSRSFKIAAREELEFLQALLPKAKKQ